MAEPFGIAAGAVGIAAAFTACVDCFEYVQIGRHFGRDYQSALLSLTCAKLRLTRWGHAVDVFNDPQLGRPDATPLEINTVKSTLVQIIVLFHDSEKIAKKFRLERKNADSLEILREDDLDMAVKRLNGQIKAMAMERQSRSSILKITSWALYHKTAFEDLISKISSHIDDVNDLFPATSNQRLLISQELSEIREPQDLALVEEAAGGVDEMLCNAAKEVREGHQYKNVSVKGKGQIGDAYSSDWKGGATGASHRYSGITIDKEGQGLIGNKYGGKDFWDD